MACWIHELSKYEKAECDETSSNRSDEIAAMNAKDEKSQQQKKRAGPNGSQKANSDDETDRLFKHSRERLFGIKCHAFVSRIYFFKSGARAETNFGVINIIIHNSGSTLWAGINTKHDQHALRVAVDTARSMDT